MISEIEKYFVLNKYLFSLFGIEDFKGFQEKLSGTSEGIDSEGRTHFVNVLRSGFEDLKISENQLLDYDRNIQEYLKKINSKRSEKIFLKYFQYLALLFSEIVLDNLKNRKTEFLSELNEFLRNYREKQGLEILDEFKEEDLKKLAFYMATGSGKTIIMHLNYFQFFKYKLFDPDNIILITPNESLSRQHYRELQKSSIPARLYGEGLNTVFGEEKVLVIEMTKFVEEKKGEGVTLPVEAFEGKNLVFVDEGHKGKKSEEQKWAKLRNKLAENGFVFEYSATFAQILSEKNVEILKEYSKSIVFDFSYKYFYLDGYGKDFSVLNIKPSKISDKKFQEVMFVANLLSFYEQLLIFQENQKLAQEYNLEKPLWIFVGSTVTGEEKESDVIQVVNLFKKVIEDKEWLQKIIDKILSGKSGIKDIEDRDLFFEKFTYLKEIGVKIEDLLKRIFLGEGKFNIFEIKNAPGELGLKVGESPYFGVVFIGDVRKFKKGLEKLGILVEQDAISSSLFDEITKENSNINVLIGAKKFIEGWDTWRVSSMGLLNIGQGQGPQIIQLFGRGVRIKGKNFSLKRSNEGGKIKVLETLNIFGIKAEYLSRFLKAIEKEEVEYEIINVPIKLLHQEKWKQLRTIAKSENKVFHEEKVLKLKPEERISVEINLLPKLEVIEAKREEKEKVKIETLDLQKQTREQKFKKEIIFLFDWQKILAEMLDFKILRGYYNLVFGIEDLKDVLLDGNYIILTNLNLEKIENEKDLKDREELSILVLKKYIDEFFKIHFKRYEIDVLEAVPLEKQIPAYFSPFIRDKKEYTYVITIKKEKTQKIIQKIKEIVENIQELFKNAPDDDYLPRIYLDSSLFVPLLIHTKQFEKISPQGLVESEKEFILGIREFLQKNKDKFKDCEIYILRNFPKIGIGFFDIHGFYPDFIMWVKDSKKEKIYFIDPKGMGHDKSLESEKIKLINSLSQKQLKEDISLEGFILSATPYEKMNVSIPKEKYTEKNVLFLQDTDWPEKLFLEFLNK